MEDDVDDTAFFGINKECTKFGFSGRCSNKFKDGADDMNSTVEFDWNVVSGNPSKEVMATNVASGFGGIQVRSITMNI